MSLNANMQNNNNNDPSAPTFKRLSKRARALSQPELVTAKLAPLNMPSSMAGGTGRGTGAAMAKTQTVPISLNLSHVQNADFMLELLSSLPMECHLGIGRDLKSQINQVLRSIESNNNNHNAASNAMPNTFSFLQRRQSIQSESSFAPEMGAHAIINNNNNMTSIIPLAPHMIPPTAHLDSPMGDATRPPADNITPFMRNPNATEFLYGTHSMPIPNPNTVDLNFENTNTHAPSKYSLNTEEFILPLQPSPHKFSHSHQTNTNTFGYKSSAIQSILDLQSIMEHGYTKHLMYAVCNALIGAFLYGYNTSLLNVPATVIVAECNLTEPLYSSLQSFFCAGGLIGALSAGKLADHFGRKLCFVIIDVIFMVSGVLNMGYAYQLFGALTLNTFWFFSAARFLAGISAAMSTAIIPTYLGEISPPLIRGSIGTLNQLTICFGIVFAGIIGYSGILGSAELWPLLFSLNIVLPFIQLCTLWRFLPESPKYLMTKDLNESAAREVLCYLRECKNVEMDMRLMRVIQRRKTSIYSSFASLHSLVSVETVSEECVDIKYHDVSEHNALLPTTMPAAANNTHKPSSFDGHEHAHDVLNYNTFGMNNTNTNTKHIMELPLHGGGGGGARASGSALMTAPLQRRRSKSKSPSIMVTNNYTPQEIKKILFWAFTIAIVMQLLQQLSGINSVFYYSAATLQNAGLTSPLELWLGTVLITGANFLAVLIPVRLMDRVGRKALLMTSCVGMVFASVSFSIVLYFTEYAIAGHLSIACLIAYVIAFEIGLGPISWLMMAEITPSSHRAQIVSIATFVNWASNLIIAQFAATIVVYFQYFPFAIVCICGVVFTSLFVPETKGKTEAEIQQALLNMKNPFIKS